MVSPYLASLLPQSQERLQPLAIPRQGPQRELTHILFRNDCQEMAAEEHDVIETPAVGFTLNSASSSLMTDSPPRARSSARW